MTTLVKICGLRDRETVDAAVACGADAVGFVFADSVRRVTTAEAKAAAANVPDDVLRVAVMLHPSREEWNEVAENFRPDVLQTDIDDFDYLDVPADIRRWPVIREGSATVTGMPDTFVYEGRHSGKGQRVDWSRAAQIARSGNMILAGGLAPSNVAAAISEVAPFGVDVSSAVESRPGVKDLHRIEMFIAAAKGAAGEVNEFRNKE
ncbi:MAG: phosphoribosylanthranilate isomerase [Gammaproteobacteria bacterium]|nr:phosphoribosylanthranilate isomerase [Gammaproteobacteria bacterium]